MKLRSLLRFRCKKELCLSSQNGDCLPYLKQIALYVSRASPKTTVTHLVSQLPEINLQSTVGDRQDESGVVDFSSWQLTEIFPSKTQHELFSPSLISIAMLSDIFSEQLSECSPYFPLILHSIFLAGDLRNEIVTSNAFILLHNTLLSLLENQPTPRMSIDIFKSRMNSFHSSFWTFEDIESDKLVLSSTMKLEQLVEFVLETLSWDASLRKEWASVSMNSAFSTNDPHVTARSLQVYRSLKRPLEPNHLYQLIVLFRGSFDKKESFSVSLEIIYSLRQAFECTPKETLASMPQIFWVTVAIFYSINPIVYNAGVLLLSGLIHNGLSFILSQPSFSSSFPMDGWSPPFQGFLVYVLKGLTHRATEIASLQVVADMCVLPHNLVIDIDPYRRLLCNTVSLLPYLGLFLGKEGTKAMAEGLYFMYSQGAGTCCNNSSKYANIFLRYSSYEFPSIIPFYTEIAKEIATSFFPQYELLTFSLLIELLDRGNPQYAKSILLLLNSLILHVDLEKSLLEKTGFSLFSSIDRHTNGSYSDISLNLVRKLISAVPLEQSQISHSKNMNVLHRLDDMEIYSTTWSDIHIKSSMRILLDNLRYILNTYGVKYSDDSEPSDDSSFSSQPQNPAPLATKNITIGTSHKHKGFKYKTKRIVGSTANPNKLFPKMAFFSSQPHSTSADTARDGGTGTIRLGPVPLFQS